MTDTNVCTACYGKGYYSVYSGYTRTGDFVGDQSGRVDGESKRTCPRCGGTGKEPTGVTIDKLQESFSNPDVFVRGEAIAVQLSNQEEFDAYMKLAHERGFVRKSTSKSKNFTKQDIESGNLCVDICKGFLEWDFKSWYEQKGWKILKWKDYVAKKEIEIFDRFSVSFSDCVEFVRGEEVEVSDDDVGRTEKIYLTTIEGTYQPYVCVHSDFVGEYKRGAPFYTTPRKYIRKIPQQEAGPRNFTREEITKTWEEEKSKKYYDQYETLSLVFAVFKNLDLLEE